jgi:hypothetical protein
MPSRRTRHRPALELLEDRLALSTDAPANTLAIVSGTVTAAGATAAVSVPITARNIGGRVPIVIGTATSPTAGSGLNPRVIAALGPNGRHLALQPGAPFNAAAHNEATAYVQVGTPGPLTLEVTGAGGTTGSFQLRAYLPGDINGDGQVTLADERAFTKVYRTQLGDANYNPAADANLNNQIGQDDGRFLLRNLKPLGPKTPLLVKLTLAPQFAVKPPVPSNSGGHTYFQNPTILGKTTPGSLIFTDGPAADYAFNGSVVAADAKGNFSIQVKNSDGVNNNDFLVVDPFGQQKIMDFPIYYFPAVFRSGRTAPPPLVAVPTAPAAPSHPLPKRIILPAGTP